MHEETQESLERSSPETSAIWYGVSSLVLGYGTLLVFILFNKFHYVAANKEWFMSVIVFFMPTGMSWAFLRWFPTDFMRKIFRLLSALSIFGPFFTHWAAIANFVLVAEDGGKEDTGYDEFGFYTALAAYVSVTMFQMVVQIVWLPEVFDWVDAVTGA